MIRKLEYLQYLFVKIKRHFYPNFNIVEFSFKSISIVSATIFANSIYIIGAGRLGTLSCMKNIVNTASCGLHSLSQYCLFVNLKNNSDNKFERSYLISLSDADDSDI